MGLLSTFGAATARAYGFTRSAIAQSVDAYFNRVTLLLPGNGTNGAQNNTFLDSGTANGGVGFTITRNPSTGPNAPTQGTFSPFSQTGWSNYFGGDGGTTVKSDQISFADNAALELGSSDFCIEAWIYLTATPTTTVRICDKDAASNTSYLFYINSSRNPALNFSTNGSAITTLTSTGTVSTNTWNHVAITRSGSTFTFWINGASSGTSTNAVTIFNGTAVLRIGNASSNDRCFPGYISNFRLTTGAPVYTIAFTPSTTPLTTTVSSGTVALLTCQSNRFIDNSANAVITVTGTPSVQAFSPFAPTAAYSAATNGGSGYFDGTGDFLTAANATSLDLSTGDFTVEAFFYVTTSSGNQAIVARNNGNISTGNDAQYAIFITSGNIYVRPYSSTTDYSINLGSVPVNQWCHVALVRTGNTFYGYLNGARNATTQTISGSLNNSTWSTYVGQYSVSSAAWPFSGYISQVRILKGTAQYTTATITVPTSPLTAITNTSLLLNFTNAGITDATAKNDLETVGNAQISTTQSKFGGSSMYFDGTGDWLTIIDNPNLQMGSGDFTIEGWFYLSATGVAYGIVSKGTSTTGWSVNITSGNKLQFSYTSSNLTGATTLSSATWYYFAVVRSGTATGNLKVYLNGSADATSAGAVTDNFNQTNIMYVGADRVGTSALNGYIDDLRITKGYARTISASPSVAFPVQ